MSHKILIIAIDGGTFDLIKPWCDEGHLPTINQLMREGVHGELESSWPPITPVAWASFMTGKNPGKHGIFDFFKKDAEVLKRRAVNSRTIDGDTIWKIASEYKKGICVVSCPLTYPVEKVRGCLISGLMTPRGVDDYIYPEELKSELDKKTGGCQVHHSQIRQGNSIKSLISELHRLLENRLKVGSYLLKNKEWELAFIHFFGSDRVQHELWHLIDPEHPLYNEKIAQRQRQELLRYFKELDKAIKKLIDVVDSKKTNIIIMSDHGFGPTHKFFNINTLLLNRGIIKIKKNIWSQIKYTLWKLGYCPSVFYRLLESTYIGKLRNRLAVDRRTNLANRMFLSFSDVDWDKSLAYSAGNYGEIYLNKKAIGNKGSGQPSSEEVLTRLKNILMSMKNERTGEPVIKKFIENQKLYTGKYTSQGGDLLFELADMRIRPNNRVDFSSPSILEDCFVHPGDHRTEGIFIAAGPDFRSAQQIQGANIMDLTPTILYLLDIPILSDMDGRILLDAITSEYESAHQAKYRSKVVKTEDEEAGSESVGEANEEDIKRQLRNLGYMG